MDKNSLNKVILIGRLGGNPELKYLPQSEMAVARFNIATSESRKDKEDHTEWHKIVVWGKIAEYCEKYVAKGQRICVIGKLRTRDYEKDGAKHYITEVNADQVISLGEKRESQSQNEESTAGATPDDENIPF